MAQFYFKKSPVSQADWTVIQPVPGNNVSRRLTDGFQSLLYSRKNKAGEIIGPSNNFLDLVQNLVDDGYDVAKGGCLVATPALNATEQKVIDRTRNSLAEQIAKLVFSKTGGLEFDVGTEKPFVLTPEIAANWVKKNFTTPTKKSKAKLLDSVSGSCRWLALILANPVREAAGKPPIMMVPIETRTYKDVGQRAKDIGKLNEDESGKQKTTMLEKFNMCFYLRTKGARQRDFTQIFGGKNAKRGQVQLFWSTTSNVGAIGEVDKEKAAHYKSLILDGTLQLTQTHQKDLQAMWMACCHTDFSTSWNKDTFIGQGRLADPIGVQENIISNPEKTVTPIVTYFERVLDPAFVPEGRKKGMSRKDIRQKASTLDKDDLRRELMLAISDNDSDATDLALEKISKLVEPVYLRKSDGSLDKTAVVTQPIHDSLMAGKPGYPKKKGSGRKKKVS